MRRVGRFLCLSFMMVFSYLHAANPPDERKGFAKKREEVRQSVEDFMKSLTPTEKSALQEKLNKEKEYDDDDYGIELYRPSYILPYYYTSRPYYAIYEGQTPNDQQVMHSEFKGQLSIVLPFYEFNSHMALKASYTQFAYWQFYAHSQYFRETDYEPQIFLSSNFMRNWLFDIGLNHQSNGRGGTYERSWNRAYVDLSFSGDDWMVSLKPWMLIYKGGSSDLHNPDIAHYLGYGRILLAYRYKGQEVTFMSRNNLTSAFKRGAVEMTYSFPLKGRLRGFVEAFSGYGQSLIEYDHYTAGLGIGVAFNDWI